MPQVVADNFIDFSLLPFVCPPDDRPTMSSPKRLLVCSIGNPGAYLCTLHSAGHAAVERLRQALAYPAFASSPRYGRGLVSAGPDFTLWQSSSAMNVSGPAVGAAWRQFLRDGGGRLVVVHDDLEAALGRIRVRGGGGSARGHNGLRSIQETLCRTGTAADYLRVGIGIGRPQSRESRVVAEYVLRKMSPHERNSVEACVGELEAELRRIAMGGA